MKKALHNNLYMLSFMWKYCKSNVIFRLLTVLTAPVQPFVFILTMKLAIDGIAERRGLNYILGVILMAFLAGSISAVFNAWVTNSSSARAKQKLSKGLQGELLEKLLVLDLSCYDNAEFYDKYVRAMQEAEKRAIEVLNSVIETLSSFTALISIGALLFASNPVVILLCLVILVANLFLNTMKNKINYKWDKEMTRSQREARYARKIFYEPQYAQELRMGKLGPLMKGKFFQAMDKTLNIVKKYCGKMVFFDSAFNIIGYVLMASVMAFAAWQITIGKLSIGDFAALLNGSQQLLEKLFSLFGQIPKLYQNSMYIDNFREIMDYKPQIESGKENGNVKKLEEGIRLENLSFTYPGKEKPVLKNINMEILKGKKTALVGYNGVGKTTLVKLILRFYDPDSGKITMDGTNYRELDIESLRKEFGVLFQDYKCYALNVAENVAFEEEISEEMEKKIISSLKYSGIYEKVSGFKNGIYTNLSREFDSDGVPLSGGEQQKIGISRAFAEGKDILILDEPSSALDPIAEYDMNQKIIGLAEDRTILFISHRLSTVRMADYIYMLDGGEIIEAGTHEELMELNGKYCDMFRKQAENYME